MKYAEERGQRVRHAELSLISDSSAELDAWTQERFYVDFGTIYEFSEPFSVYFNAKNLTDTPLKFAEGPGENRITQREFYSVTLQFGANYKI